VWDYTYMKGIHPDLCTHHIYIKEYCWPIRQPQLRMNPALKDIIKEELQKLLNVNFHLPNIKIVSGYPTGHCT
jgi:hypothetical protein